MIEWKIPAWTLLRTLGNSKILRSSYFWLFFVPIAAKLLLQIKSPLEFELFGQTHEIHLGLPFSWYAFYFAAVAFSVASFLYSAFCPKLIKNYSSFTEYYQSGSGARSLANELFGAPGLDAEGNSHDLGEELVSALHRSGGISEGTAENIRANPILQGKAHFAQISREELGDLFDFNASVFDVARPNVRLCISIFYAIGFVFTLIVAGQGLLGSFTRVYKRLATSVHRKSDVDRNPPR